MRTLFSQRSFKIIFLFAASFYLSSCKKGDLPQPSNSASSNYERFFSVPSTVSPEAKAIAAAIKRQDAQYHFIDAVIAKAGYPVWDKIKIATNTIANSKNSSEGEIAYVPFVLDSQKRTDALLCVQLSTDTVYRMAYANRYKQFGYDTADHTKWNARNAFQVFTSFDNAIFGRTKFLIKDPLLFKPLKDSMSLIATLKNDESQKNNTTGRTDWTVNCITYELCFKDNSGVLLAAKSSFNENCSTFDICTLIDPGTGSGGSGSGGAGTSGWFGVGDGAGNPATGGGGGWYQGGGGGDCNEQANQKSVGNDCGNGWVPGDGTDPNTITISGIATAEQIEQIVAVLKLKPEEKKWLLEHTDRAYEIYEILLIEKYDPYTLKYIQTQTSEHLNKMMTDDKYLNRVKSLMPYKYLPGGVPFDIYFFEIVLHGNNQFTNTAFLKAGEVFGVPKTNITRIGRIFENGVLNSGNSMGSQLGPKTRIFPYPNTEPTKYFLPDFMADFPVFLGSATVYNFSNANMSDSKFTTTGKIVLESYWNPEQLKGFIDYLGSDLCVATRNGVVVGKAADYSVAILVLKTPWDVTVDQTIIDYAKSKNVSIWQQVAVQVTPSGIPNCDETCTTLYNQIKTSRCFMVCDSKVKVNDPNYTPFITFGGGGGHPVSIDWTIK